MKKRRLDDILVERGLIAKKEEAFVVVTEGRVFVDGQKAVSPGQAVGMNAKIAVRDERQYVGRGAYKLAAAVKEFKPHISGAVCADIGAATGGFTEVLLENGAAKVYAIDTAKGKLDQKIREHPRVVVMEETNALFLASLPERVDLVTIDVSFTSLRLIFSVLKKFLKQDARVIGLFKPQYEVPKRALKHGVVRDEGERREALEAFVGWAEAGGWRILGTMTSPIRGSEGNIEYLVYACVRVGK